MFSLCSEDVWKKRNIEGVYLDTLPDQCWGDLANDSESDLALVLFFGVVIVVTY